MIGVAQEGDILQIDVQEDEQMHLKLIRKTKNLMRKCRVSL